MRIASRGAWYVKFIHMQRATADTTIDYESKWATLTFGVRYRRVGLLISYTFRILVWPYTASHLGAHG